MNVCDEYLQSIQAGEGGISVRFFLFSGSQYMPFILPSVSPVPGQWGLP